MISQDQTLQVNITDGVMWLTKTNAAENFGISLAMWSALTTALERAAVDPTIKIIVIDAAAPGFHRGAVMVTELGPNLAGLTRADFRDLVQRGQALGRLIAELPKPVIGIATAGALGGGLELLLRCDFLYTLDNAQFSFPEVTLGFVAAWGGTQWGGRLMPFRSAQEMLLLGDKISGREAVEFGLVTRSFPTPDELSGYVGKVIARLAYCSPASFAQTKKCLSAIWQGPIEYGERIEMEAEAESMASGDFVKAYEAWKSGKSYSFADNAVTDDRAPTTSARF